MTVEKGTNLPCPFAGQERAHRIDQPASGPNELRGDSEQALLSFDQALKPLWGEPPTAFRIPAPGTAARARRIHQDQVRRFTPVCELVEFAWRVQQTRFDMSAR